MPSGADFDGREDSCNSHRVMAVSVQLVVLEELAA